MSIGPATLANIAESLRKIRNTARFAIANVRRPDAVYTEVIEAKEDLRLVRKAV